MTGPLTALVVVAGVVPALLLIGLGIWFQISCLGRLAVADQEKAARRSERGGRHPPRPDVRRHLVPAPTPCGRPGELNGRRWRWFPSGSRISAPPERRTRVTSAAV